MENYKFCNRSVSTEFSDIQSFRFEWNPVLPKTLKTQQCDVKHLEDTFSVDDNVAKLFPSTYQQRSVQFVNHKQQNKTSDKVLNVAILFSGGQAPGGHNVILGIHDFLMQHNNQNKLYGILGGSKGLFTKNYIELNAEIISKYKNAGGFHMIGSGRDKIETNDQLQKCLELATELDLDGIVITGGDDSNTNSAVLAEFFASKKHKCVVTGVPKTIDGDLKNQYIECSYGFDTACKIYSELIGNIASAILTTKDKYCFVRLMGRAASNILLECALRTSPNLALCSEEIKAKNRSLENIVDEIVDLIVERHRLHKDYGIILIAEGLVEFIPEIGVLISELNEILKDSDTSFDKNQLTQESLKIFDFLPEQIRISFLADRDSHGNVQVSKIETEVLLMMLVEEKLRKQHKEIDFKFSTQFFGYEGRCSMPSNFDSNYCYSLGYIAGNIINNKLNGYIATVSNLSESVELWIPKACPLVKMINLEKRKGKNVPVIKKYLVELDGPCFKVFDQLRKKWRLFDSYESPGGIQFEGPFINDCPYLVNKKLLEDIISRNAKKLDGIITSPLLDHRKKTQLQIHPKLCSPDCCSKLLQQCSAVSSSCTCSTRYLTFDVEAGQNFKQRNQSFAVIHLDTPAPGSTNVLIGIYKRAQQTGNFIKVFATIDDIFANKYITINSDFVENYTNTGTYPISYTQYDLSKYSSNEKLEQIIKSCEANGCSALIIAGGLNAMAMALLLNNCKNNINSKLLINAVPVSYSNDVHNDFVELTVGFNSYTKTLAQVVSSLCIDCISAKKYWFLVSVESGLVSDIMVEVALQCHPNITILPESYLQKPNAFEQIISDITDIIVERSILGQNYGVILTSNSIESFFFEDSDNIIMQICEDIKINTDDSGTIDFLSYKLSLAKIKYLYNKKLKKLNVGEFILYLVSEEIKLRKEQSVKFNYFTFTYFDALINAIPSNFDCTLGLTNGYLAAILCEDEQSGYITSCHNMSTSITEWKHLALNLRCCNTVVDRSMKLKSSYNKLANIIRLSDRPSLAFLRSMDKRFALSNYYTLCGSIQFFGKMGYTCPYTYWFDYNDKYELYSQLREILKNIQYLTLLKYKNDSAIFHKLVDKESEILQKLQDNNL